LAYALAQDRGGNLSAGEVLPKADVTVGRYEDVESRGIGDSRSERSFCPMDTLPTLFEQFLPNAAT
jgi:hypothetical protein